MHSSPPTIFGVIISLLIFHELPKQFIIAFFFMGAGTWLLISEKHSHRHFHEALRHSHRHSHDDLHHDSHIHGPEVPPPVDNDGYHSHPHWHKQGEHEHPHRPDLHHRHTH
ncbi:hypothetical protein [Methanogenium cariaci]|uniref:hypothetical protein n=1 Tax=Methanogenium cariaci TaxID=2197 RepID=UPI001FE1EAA6|nr:hypothetical protein [Methanogenium cariaci]